MADSIEEKMKYLSKRYGCLNRGKGGMIWDKLNSVLESFLSGNTLVAYSDFYNLFQENISEMRKCTIHIIDEFYRMRKGENAITEYTLSLQKKAISLNDQGKTMIAKDSFVPLL